MTHLAAYYSTEAPKQRIGGGDLSGQRL